MIEIDGSYGEGGGGVVRTAVSLSAITQDPVRIVNIRANREKTGLAAQHMKAVQAVQMMTDASVEGLKMGSKEIVFSPKEIRGGRFNIDVGTAGSITLVLQSIIPVAIFSGAPVEVFITGGTDVLWSPSIDFFRYITVPALRSFGVKIEIDLIRRGYYPKGMGLVKATIYPSKLKGRIIESRDGQIRGISHSSGLPSHVAKRQLIAAKTTLIEAGLNAEIKLEQSVYESTGSGITLWWDHKGGSALGKRGKAAEEVGIEAAESLISEMRSDSSVDRFLSDQLILYMALAKGGSEFSVKRFTGHTKTNIWVTRQFLDVEFEGKEGVTTIISTKNL
ncbi:MAG: RNA 3'-terminal phosphate cyclase [Halobacteriota archaeon]|nr:RNA 3'-terminal phosphate cyclase [Halobacteriota archaeon]